MANESNKKNKTNLERRDLLKGLAGVPVAGFFFLNLWQKIKRDDFQFHLQSILNKQEQVISHFYKNQYTKLIPFLNFSI